MKSEYGHAVYCDATNYGPMRGGREEAGVTGGDVWWEQARIDLSGARETAAAAAAAEAEAEAEAEAYEDGLA